MDVKKLGANIDLAISQYHLGYKITANLDGIEDKFRAYTKDARNSCVLASSIQKSFDFKINSNRYFGCIDQLRQHKDIRVWEIKYTEKETPLDFYITQLLIYACAFQVGVGGVINVKNYGTNKPVFYGVRNYYVPTTRDMELLDNYLMETRHDFARL